MKQRIICIIILLITLGWMAVIFSFSAQTGTESGSLSAAIAEPLTKWISQLKGGLSAQEEAALYQQVHTFIRKAAHFTEYGILGGLLYLLSRAVKIKWVWLAWLAGTAYAITDEWHQSFTPGRACTPVDVLIDSAGVMTGILMICIIIHFNMRRKNHVHHS